MLENGIVFNVQRFTLHDGPGIRTELFLKGCPLRCEWCGNPESFEVFIEPGVFSSKCIGLDKCGACLEVCEDSDMLIFEDQQLTAIDRDKCTNCLKCIEACPSDAIKQWGKSLSVEECMKVIRKDKGFYERSGGGLTVSGGEPLMQSKFVAQLFKEAQKEGIHTCCESCLFINVNELNKVLPYTDLFIADIKMIDNEAHIKNTGGDNICILNNLKEIAKNKVDLILRIPIIPNVNDNLDNMKATADFIINELDNRVRTLQLLSFMRLGEEKYKSLNKPYLMEDLEFDRDEFQDRINEFAEYFNQRGIHTLVGTKEK